MSHQYFTIILKYGYLKFSLLHHFYKIGLFAIFCFTKKVSNHAFYLRFGEEMHVSRHFLIFRLLYEYIFGLYLMIHDLVILEHFLSLLRYLTYQLQMYVLVREEIYYVLMLLFWLLHLLLVQHLCLIMVFHCYLVIIYWFYFLNITKFYIIYYISVCHI